MNIPINTQRNPVGYLARKFAIQYNLPNGVRLAGTNPIHVPNLSTVQALALAAFALLRLRTAELAATDDVPGAWDTELADAQALADKAIIEVSATHSSHFPTPQRIFAKLQKYGDVHNSGSIPAPGNLPIDWATNKGALPVATPQAISQANNVAVNINLLAGVTNAEGATETLKVLTVDDKNWQAGRKFTKSGVEFTMTGTSNLTAAAPGSNKVIPLEVELTDGVTAPVTRTTTLTTTTPV